MIFEQKGCPYCREMHTVNFAEPEVTIDFDEQDPRLRPGMMVEVKIPHRS